MANQLTRLSVTSFLPPAMKLGQGYVFTGMCDSVHGGGVSASVHAGIPPHPLQEQTPPRSRHPLGTDTPRNRHPPAQSMLGDTVNAREVRILLEGIRVFCNVCESLTLISFVALDTKTQTTHSNSRRSVSP